MLVKLKYLSQILNYSSSSSSIVLKESNILITKDGTVGKVFLLTSENLEFLKSRYSSYLVLKPSSSCPPSYLYYYLLSPYFSSWYSEIKKSFATINHLNISDLKEFPIIFSSLPIQQQKLIDFLNKKSHLIQQLLLKIDLLLKKLEDYQASILYEQLIQNNSSTNYIKLKYLFQERNELTLDNLTYPRYSVTKKGIVFELDSISKSRIPKDRKIIYPNDLILKTRSWYGHYLSAISTMTGSIASVYIVFYPISKYINPIYVSYLLQTNYFQNIFYYAGNGIGFEYWSTHYNQLKELKWNFPSLLHQNEIVSFLTPKLEALSKLKHHYTSLRAHLEEYQASLLYETFQHLS